MGFELKKLVNLFLIESGPNQRRKLFLGGFIVKITQNFRVCLAIFISGYFLGAAGVPVDRPDLCKQSSSLGVHNDCTVSSLFFHTSRGLLTRCAIIFIFKAEIILPHNPSLEADGS